MDGWFVESPDLHPRRYGVEVGDSDHQQWGVQVYSLRVGAGSSKRSVAPSQPDT